MGQEVFERAASEPAGVMEVELIEGDTVTVDHVKVRKISADKIIIGENCVSWILEVYFTIFKRRCKVAIHFLMLTHIISKSYFYLLLYQLCFRQHTLYQIV